MAGTWTASEPSPIEPFDAAEAPFGAPLRLFVRQPLTRSDPGGRDVVQSVVDIACNPIIAGGPVCLLPNGAAQHAATFRDSFTAATGLPFTASAFRAWRLSLIDTSDAMLVIRTELSESGAYEIAYNVHAGPRVPIFFAVHRSCPIRTTLLQELDELVEAQYQLFTHPSELIEALHRFLTSCDAGTAPLAPGKARH